MVLKAFQTSSFKAKFPPNTFIVNHIGSLQGNFNAFKDVSISHKSSLLTRDHVGSNDSKPLRKNLCDYLEMEACQGYGPIILNLVSF